MCGKIIYRTRRVAKAVLHLIRERDGATSTGRMHAYRCGACGGWHLGHGNGGPCGCAYRRHGRVREEEE